MYILCSYVVCYHVHIIMCRNAQLCTYMHVHACTQHTSMYVATTCVQILKECKGYGNQ